MKKNTTISIQTINKAIDDSKGLYRADTLSESTSTIEKESKKPITIKRANIKIKPLQTGAKTKNKKNPMNTSNPVKQIEIAAYKCVVCKCGINSPNRTIVVNQSDRSTDFICDNCCKNGNIFTCQSCKVNHIQDLSKNDGYCLGCIESAPKNLIRGYQDKAERHFDKLFSTTDTKFNDKEYAGKIFGNKNPNSFVVNASGVHPILFGVELEYETIHSWGRGVLKVNQLIKNFAVLKRDRTLKQGFEIVSAPADKHFHYSAWNELFNVIENDDNIWCAPFNPRTKTGCGCHIHISKDAMMNQNSYGKINAGPGLAVAKLLSFIHHKNNRKFVECMAGRKSNMYSNFYKKRGPQIDNNGKIVSGIIDVTQAAFDHRTAINFHSSNGQTIEFRIFRSTKNREELLKNIDFVEAICTFCRTGNSSLQETTDWIHFYEFVCKNRQDYPYLFKFFNSDKSFLDVLDKKEKNIITPDEEEEADTEIGVDAPLPILGGVTNINPNFYGLAEPDHLLNEGIIDDFEGENNEQHVEEQTATQARSYIKKWSETIAINDCFSKKLKQTTNDILAKVSKDISTANTTDMSEW